MYILNMVINKVCVYIYRFIRYIYLTYEFSKLIKIYNIPGLVLLLGRLDIGCEAYIFKERPLDEQQQRKDRRR
jgi:hypothetical protein